jgi:hypothetical protein
MTPDDITAVTRWLAAQPVPAGAKAADAPARPLPMRCGGVPPAQQDGGLTQ